eukprot:SAG22_NODE_1296_length_4822_cov_3.066271_6_plen_102_part_00
MLADAVALLPDLQTALARTAAIARRAGGPCPFAFVAGGNSCTVADETQPPDLRPRENEPWRTYSELMYSGVLPLMLVQVREWGKGGGSKIPLIPSTLSIKT